MVPYNDDTKQKAIEQIEYFSANFGGTQIYQPIETAFNTNIDKDT